MTLTRSLAASAALVLLALAPAAALTLRSVPFDDLVRQADGIARGTIVAKSAEWDAAHRYILTRYTLHVDEMLKPGQFGNEITFTELGGTVDGLTFGVPGTPEYRVGEEALVFFHVEQGRLMTLSWTQGQFAVHRDGSGAARVRQATGPIDEALATFTARVRAIATGAR